MDFGNRSLSKNVLGKTQAEVKEKLKKALEECLGVHVSKAADKYTVTTWRCTWYEFYTVPRIGTIKLKKRTTRRLQKLYKELLN